MFEIGPLSLYAKILAQENITVTIENTVETAAFDLKHRQLIIPDWEFKDDNFTKMLVAHEVGHAIFTPLDKWAAFIDALPNEEKHFAKHFVNVVEDCRNDRLMQERYPGLRSTYMHAADFIVKENFFKLVPGTENSLSFIDRLNIYFKSKYGNNEYKIHFSRDEKKYVERIRLAETFDEVLQISKELMEKYKSEATTRTFEDLENFTPDDKKEEESDEEGQKQQLSMKGRVSVEEGNGEKADHDPEAIPFHAPGLGCTQENFLANLKDKNETLNVAVSYRAHAGSKNIKRINVADVMNQEWRTSYRRQYGQDAPGVRKRPNQVRTDWRNFVNGFCSSFERKKNARNFMKTREEKTGILNFNKLYEYAYNDDIFLSNVVENKNKNHGFVFLIDCSGSMQNVFQDVITQLVVLTEICRKLQIPCRAYGFSDYYKPRKQTVNFSGTSTSLLEFYDDRKSRKENEDNFTKLLNSEISLSGTPLGDSLYYMLSLIDEFKRESKVDVVNFISLTDGGDGTGNPYTNLIDDRSRTLVKSDFSTRLTLDNTSAMYRMIRKVTGAKITHVDITDVPTNGSSDFARNGFSVIKEYGGADQTFFIKPKNLTPTNKKLIELLVDALK